MPHEIIRILGIDPALRCTGWGVVEKHGSALRYVASGTIQPDTKAPLTKRLGQLGQEVQTILRDYTIDTAAIEETFLNANPQSTLKLGMARGALISAVAMQDITITQYAARLIKQAVSSSGRADKHQIMAMVNMLLPGAQITQTDEADALATAICHAHHSSIAATALVS